MKKYFAYERNPMGKLQPVLFYGHVPTQSSGGHVTEKVGIKEIPESFGKYDIDTLVSIYPEPRS